MQTWKTGPQHRTALRQTGLSLMSPRGKTSPHVFDEVTSTNQNMDSNTFPSGPLPVRAAKLAPRF